MQNVAFPLEGLERVRGKHLLVALSGGADSVALACLLAEAKQSYGLTLTCAHMDHGIRPESASDAQFCREFCRDMDLPLQTVRVDVPAIARAFREGIETCARRVRYEWLRKVKEAVRADHIALAHHMDDQAETVLMHLFRGAGPEGASGMRVFSGDLFRPLTGVRKQALVEYLSERNISWREDATNAVGDNPRNDIRLNVIPAIEKSYPQAVSAIARFARAQAEESDLVARLSEVYARENVETGPYGTLIRLAESFEPAILKRIVRRICGPGLESAKLEEVMALCQNQRGKTDISSDMFAERGRSGLYFLPKCPAKTPQAKLSLDGTTLFGDFCRIEAEDAPPVPVRDDPMRQVLNKDTLRGAVVRTREDGDRIRPLGSGEKLLSDYFTDKKIDRPLRDHIPLVAVGKNILWAAGVGISGDACIRSASDPCVMLKCTVKANKRN